MRHVGAPDWIRGWTDEKLLVAAVHDQVSALRWQWTLARLSDQGDERAAAEHEATKPYLMRPKPPPPPAVPSSPEEVIAFFS